MDLNEEVTKGMDKQALLAHLGRMWTIVRTCHSTNIVRIALMRIEFVQAKLYRMR